MPRRNVVKVDIADSFYHIYSRGHGGQAIFREAEDYEFFLNLFERHLGPEEAIDRYGKPYANIRKEIELLDYVLLPNCFHLITFQHDVGAMSRLMRSVVTSYSVYFNKKYGTSGALFESRYKASRLSSKEAVMNTSRYIHIVNQDWRAYSYSAIPSFFGIGRPDWLQPERLIDLFGSAAIYADFLDDIKGYEISLDDTLEELAC